MACPLGGNYCPQVAVCIGSQRDKLLTQMFLVAFVQRHEVHYLPREHIQQHPRITAQSAQAGVEYIEGVCHVLI